ncbi:MFS transporter [Roseivivax sp. THAF30]|uniref:MFS transporter n=1 Tax=Roseivivax sp. THAF30 TaxID=2587852 RepID=UPI001268BF1F|nr:MFS transporter [Roseivivax sp. THAF30]QFT64947.1 Major Facilitator Superfamily protein [Roseivivax sp. THAF30]
MSLLSFLRGNAPWLAAGAMLTFLSSFGQTFFISIFAGDIREAFDLSHSSWGAIYAAGTTASAVAMVWAGGLTDRFRSRALGAAILVALAASCLFMAVNTAAALLPFAIFALRFAGQGMTSHIAMAAMSRWFIATRGRALSIAGLGVTVGNALLPIVFVALMAVFDWRALWMIAAAIALLGLPLLLTLLRTERTPQSFAAESAGAFGMGARHWTRLEALRHPLFWLMVPALLGPPAWGTAFFFQQVHYAEVKDWPLIAIVSWLPLFTAVTVGAMLASGWAIDRFGVAKVYPTALLPSVAAFFVFALAADPLHVGLGLVLLGMTQGAQSTLPAAFWAEFYGTRHIGAIKAMGAAVMVFGTAIGPGVTGYLIDLGVGIETQYLTMAIYFLGATGIMILGLARFRTETPSSAETA